MPETAVQTLLPGVPPTESLLFPMIVDEMALTATERDVAEHLHEKGFAVFDFPDDDLDARIERLIPDLTPRYNFDAWRASGWSRNESLRLQDAWRVNEDVRAIAANQAVLDLLSKVYGRRAFPFQTLNFPVGTQQHYHSDSIHFSSAPERFMCGVWLALEDIHPDAGPLTYYPGSHRWPILYNDLIGRVNGTGNDFLAQAPYENAWRALVEATGAQAEVFCPRKGQALIWAANLLHGGSRQNDPNRTRWSQVTHYYFEDCVYYTPAFSDPLAGNLDLRTITDVSTGKVAPNIYIDRPIAEVPRRDGLAAVAQKAKKASFSLAQWLGGSNRPPKGFDPALYLELNPDVAMARLDPKQHYLKFGINEGRRYRREA
jgi:hypothetical protein